MHAGRGDSSGKPVDIVELGASPRSTLPEEARLQDGASTKRRRFRRRKAAGIGPTPSSPG
jgi:hypothetical protein